MISLTMKTSAVLFGLTSFASFATASTLFYTNFASRTINSLDTVTKATALVDSVPVGAGGNPDSLIFDSAGRIIYTIYNGAPGQIRIYDSVAHTDTLLATGFSSQLVDITLEPTTTSVLVADRGNNNLDRVNLTTGTITTLGVAGSFADLNGLTYDGSGNLFGVSAGKVIKINPTTGAVLLTGTGPGGFLDGLTFDSFSNKLWGATGSCLYSFDLATLTASACVNTSTIGTGNDGIESDGLGHLFFAASGSAIVGQYTITGGALVAVSNNLGSLDDIAPASGLGAPPPSSPEPSTFVFSGIGLALAVLARRRKV